MSRKKNNSNDKPGLTIDYSRIGVMTIEEFKQALWTDIQILKDEHNVKYITKPKLKLGLTDAFGECTPLRGRYDSKPIYRLHTQYNRPACWDYDLS